MNQQDKSQFHWGSMANAYRFFGNNYNQKTKTATFRVFAPRAIAVSVVGDFNNWDTSCHVLNNDGGIWSLTVKNLEALSCYKYYIATSDGRALYKSDPFAFHADLTEKNSKLYDLSQIKWTDGAYIKNRTTVYDKPVNIYEAHIGSWRKFSDGNFFSYRRFADEITPYLKKMRYTHIELMGIAEYPFEGSWGYQVTNFYAPTSRYGLPEDFAYLVNKLHKNNIGVILDWVPGHFPKDANGLYEFDGYPLYEPEDPLRREHKEWGTNCFDYGRGEVKSFLVSNAMYWLDVFHIDGLRVDAVASMLYNDYGRKEWRPNAYGGNENLEAIDFLKSLSSAVFGSFPNALLIAEESTAWPLVTKPVDVGGLGFNFKWNMGWMNDTLAYVKSDPVYRGSMHDKLTFSLTYAFSENYVLPISHDEIVHGKGSLINKMPLDYDSKFAGWRNYLMYMFCHPGKKLTMMGTEFAQFSEWAFAKELDWLLLDYPKHQNAQKFFATLSGYYCDIKAMHQIEDSFEGFAWRVVDDNAQNVVAFERKDKDGNSLLCVFNFSNCFYKDYRIGTDIGEYTNILHSDKEGWTIKPFTVKSQNISSHKMDNSIALDIPPLSAMMLQKKVPI